MKAATIQTLGHEVLDADHQAFCDYVRRLSQPGPAYRDHFNAFVEHVTEHFAREEELMHGSAFPALREHCDEHQRVLGELGGLRARVMRGQTVLARAWVNQNALDWLELHVSTMDAALVAHLGRVSQLGASA